MMKTVIFITGLIVAFATMSLFAQDSTMSLSLSTACRLGINNNAGIRNGGLEVQKSHYLFKELQSNLYPQVEGYSTFSYYYAIPKMVVPGEIFGQTGMIPMQIGTIYDWSTGFTASQVLFNQSYFTSLKLAQQMESLSSLSVEQQKEAIVFQVSQVYYLCQSTEKQIVLLALTLERDQTLADITQLQSNQGIILKTDHARVLVNSANLQTQIDNLTVQHQQQLGMLKYLTGILPEKIVILTDSIELPGFFHPDSAPDFTNNLAIKHLDKQIEISHLSKKSKAEESLPTLAGFGQFYYQGQRNDFDFYRNIDQKFYKVGYLGISLNLRIFSGFEHQARMRQCDLEIQQLQNTRADIWNVLAKDYQDAMAQYQNSTVAIDRQIDNVRVAEETYTISLENYRQQVVSLSDLIMAENSLTEARLSYYNSLFQLKIAELELRKAQGKLVNF